MEGTDIKKEGWKESKRLSLFKHKELQKRNCESETIGRDGEGMKGILE